MGLIAPVQNARADLAQIRNAFAAAITAAGNPRKARDPADVADPDDISGQFRARVEADIARWTPVIKAADIKIN